MTSQIKLEIVRVLDECEEEVHGIFHLGYRLIGCNDMHWLRLKLNELESENVITITDKGAGRAKVIKRNRNSSGYPRRGRA